MWNIKTENPPIYTYPCGFWDVPTVHDRSGLYFLWTLTYYEVISFSHCANLVGEFIPLSHYRSDSDTLKWWLRHFIFTLSKFQHGSSHYGGCITRPVQYSLVWLSPGRLSSVKSLFFWCLLTPLQQQVLALALLLGVKARESPPLREIKCCVDVNEYVYTATPRERIWEPFITFPSCWRKIMPPLLSSSPTQQATSEGISCWGTEHIYPAQWWFWWHKIYKMFHPPPLTSTIFQI